MKKMLGILVVIAVLTVPICASAFIIGNVSLTERYSSPTGYATIYGTNYNLYLDYEVSLNGQAFDEAFCVENADGPGSTARTYTLLSIDSSLSSFGLNPNAYLAAAWIAEYYYSNYNASPDSSTDETWKAGAQNAVWEIIFDDLSFDLASGNFRTSNAYADEAQTLWNSKPSQLPSYSSTWALAVNPTVQEDDTITTQIYQNYLVRYNVPEPALLLLLGLGLVGLAGIRRFMSK